MNRVVARVLSVVAVVCMVACGSRERSVEVHDTEAAIWQGVEEFEYENSDTLSSREIAILLRYDRGEVADSIPLRVMTISPDSLLFEEEFVLRVPRLGDMRPAEHSFPYRSRVVFDKIGRYTLRITAEEPVEGISSVGVVISEEGNI